MVEKTMSSLRSDIVDTIDAFAHFEQLVQFILVTAVGWRWTTRAEGGTRASLHSRRTASS
jgi:hypothetical protein